MFAYIRSRSKPSCRQIIVHCAIAVAFHCIAVMKGKGEADLDEVRSKGQAHESAGVTNLDRLYTVAEEELVSVSAVWAPALMARVYVGSLWALWQCLSTLRMGVPPSLVDRACGSIPPS